MMRLLRSVSFTPYVIYRVILGRDPAGRSLTADQVAQVIGRVLNVVILTRLGRNFHRYSGRTDSIVVGAIPRSSKDFGPIRNHIVMAQVF